MSNLKNVSSSPHLRSPLTTGRVMFNVIISLLPATVFGIWHFGYKSLFVVLMSIASCVGTEFVFNLITHRKNSLPDLSAVVTGLLLALVCPAQLPLYVPFVGGIFAILFAKCLFGGLGQNFMNPALAGRAFLLISFGAVMTNYNTDTVTGATPLAVIKEGGQFGVLDMFLGFAGGHLGVSIAALLVGAIFLLVTGTITWEIPVSTIVSFLIFMIALGGRGFDVTFLLQHLFGGGLILGAFFMATDYVTSPITSEGQLIYGAFIGFLAALFRTKSGMTDGMTYAIIMANLLIPFIDKMPLRQPFGIGTKDQTAAVMNGELKKGFSVPKEAIVLTLITLIAGGALAGVNAMTAETIEQNRLAAALAAYKEVIPGAEEIEYDENLTAVIESIEGYYGEGSFGKAYVNEAVVGKDASGNVVGYAVSASSMEGYDGEITLSVGFTDDGTITGITFTVLNETPGMGMLAKEDSFKGQFAGKNVEAFKLNKSGGSTADEEIDTISGASTTSGAVVNAVNAAIDFFNSNIKQ